MQHSSQMLAQHVQGPGFKPQCHQNQNQSKPKLTKNDLGKRGFISAQVQVIAHYSRKPQPRSERALVKSHSQSESNACSLAPALDSPLLPSSESSHLTGVCFITSISSIKIAPHRHATGQSGLHNP